MEKTASQPISGESAANRRSRLFSGPPSFFIGLLLPGCEPDIEDAQKAVIGKGENKFRPGFAIAAGYFARLGNPGPNFGKLHEVVASHSLTKQSLNLLALVE